MSCACNACGRTVQRLNAALSDMEEATFDLDIHETLFVLTAALTGTLRAIEIGDEGKYLLSSLESMRDYAIENVYKSNHPLE